ncbi:MAG: hypothetical protein LUC86_04575 [Prevotellaceae bacterium]|nr:hypothetical protein [Prevotellaceae bacterium]
MERDMAKGELTDVLRSRSYYRCLGDGILLLMNKMGSLAGFLWPAAVLYTVVSVVCLHLEKGLYQPILRDEVWPAEAYVLGLGVLTLLASAVFGACIVWQQRKLVETGSLPKARVWKVWREVLPSLGRLLALWCIALVVALVLVFAYALIVALLPSLAMAAKVSLGVLLFVVFFLVAAWLVQVGFEYLLSGVSLRKAFGSMSWGRRYYGRTLLLVFVSAMLCLVVSLVMSCPAMVCSYVEGLALSMRLEGDLDDLPSSFSLILSIAWLLSALGSCLSQLLFCFPLCLNWGATHAIEQERASNS